jgi:hypothetical protein
MMILVPTLIGPTPEWLAQQDLSGEDMALLENAVLPLSNTLARLLLVIPLLVLVGRIGKLIGEFSLRSNIPT